MQRTALTILGALLISGLAIQVAAASEHHHRSKANFSRDISEYRGTYNSVNFTRRAFDRFDPSTSRDANPVLNPSAS